MDGASSSFAMFPWGDFQLLERKFLLHLRCPPRSPTCPGTWLTLSSLGCPPQPHLPQDVANTVQVSPARTQSVGEPWLAAAAHLVCGSEAAGNVASSCFPE